MIASRGGAPRLRHVVKAAKKQVNQWSISIDAYWVHPQVCLSVRLHRRRGDSQAMDPHGSISRNAYTAGICSRFDTVESPGTCEGAVATTNKPEDQPAMVWRIADSPRRPARECRSSMSGWPRPDPRTGLLLERRGCQRRALFVPWGRSRSIAPPSRSTKIPRLRARALSLPGSSVQAESLARPSG